MLLMANLPAAGRAVGISPRGDAIVVGLSSGALQVHDPDSLDVSSLPTHALITPEKPLVTDVFDTSSV